MDPTTQASGYTEYGQPQFNGFTNNLLEGFDPSFFDNIPLIPNYDLALEPQSQASQNETSLAMLEALSSPPIAHRAKTRVSLACIQCRERHTKCDARKPTCTECRALGKQCTYAASRRGRNRGNNAKRLSYQPQGLEAGRPVEARNGASETSEPNTIRLDAAPGNFDLDFNTSDLHASNGSWQAGPESIDSERYIDYYFSNFHNAHPVMLPRQFLLQRLEVDRTLLRYLPVIEFIGSLFDEDAEKEFQTALRARAEATMAAADLPANPFTVQAIFVFAIATHACNDFERGRELLSKAIEVALHIKMNCKAFAKQCGEGHPVLEESFRRTWWHLYVTEGIFTGIRRLTDYTLRDVPADVDLPCEEAEFESGQIPQPRTLEEFNNREFLGDGQGFSSFAYLIALGFAIGRILPVIGNGKYKTVSPEVISVDTNLTNWALNLPKDKRIGMATMNPTKATESKLDEIIFQAHQLHNTLQVYLHRPFSQLEYSPAERLSTCAPPPCDSLIDEKLLGYTCYTAKTLRGADMGIILFTFPGEYTKLTPLTICGLTLAILAQLAACRLILQGEQLKVAREHIRLGIGAIKAMGEVWESAAASVRELQTIARETLLQDSQAVQSGQCGPPPH